jgi:hypothetical protein
MSDPTQAACGLTLEEIKAPLSAFTPMTAAVVTACWSPLIGADL